MKLAIVPAVMAWIKDDQVMLDRKFYDGVIEYKKHWPGNIVCIMNLSSDELPDFGVKKLGDKIPGIEVIVKGNNDLIDKYMLKNVDIVLASSDTFEYFYLSKLCKDIGVKCVYTIEYTAKTRYQIVSLNTSNFIIKIRRIFYIWYSEFKRKKAFSYSDGLQANGYPAYNNYSYINNTLFYLDSRMSKDMYINLDQLYKKFEYIDKDTPLRIVFSGRLNKMKGVDHLLYVAKNLKLRGCKFSLIIYGDGELFDYMSQFIVDNDLSTYVTLAGPVDFAKELVVNLKSKADIFLCLHRQGDPSCTYLETLSCGVPIIGYLNEAYSGMLSNNDIGWGVDMDKIDDVVNMIIYLDKNRDEIKGKAVNAYNFSKNHDFESTFKARINHLVNTI